MKRHILLLLTLLILSFNGLLAQIGINNPNPNTSAALDIKSNTRGLLIPRMSDLERRSLTLPANTLIVFDTVDHMLFFYDEGATEPWTAINPWNLRDDQGSFDGTFFQRDISTNETVRSVSIGSDIVNVNNQLNVTNNVSIGTIANPTGNGVTADAPENGLYVEGDVQTNNNVVVRDTTKSNVFEGFGINPIGGIIMWSGAVNNIPDGWLLCNGQQIVGGSLNGQNTPNLSGRFVVGVGNNGTTNYPTVGDTGGEDEHVLTVNEMPNHDHGGETALDGGSDQTFTDNFRGTEGVAGLGGGRTVGSNGTSNQEETISAPDHTHDIAAQGGGQAHENRPAYYVIAYIMRVL